MIVADLLQDQSTSWEAIAQGYIDKVWKLQKEFSVLQPLTSPTLQPLEHSSKDLRACFEPAIDKLECKDRWTANTASE